MAEPIEIFVASPGDVATERNHVSAVAGDLNRVMAAERDVFFKVLGWKTDVRPRVHEKGPQGPIDEDLPIPQCDIVIGIFWKRLGLPIPSMNNETGTEHEIRTALAAFHQSRKPEVVVCFNDAPYKHKSLEELDQATRLLKFRSEISGLELTYEGPDEFRDKIRAYLERYLIAHHPLISPGKISATPAAADPTRYLKALREETSSFDVQGLKFGDHRAYRFPIEHFYIPLTTSSAQLDQRASIPLEDAMRKERKLLVVGDPGAGKSTFLKRATFDACKTNSSTGLLPVRLEAAVFSAYIAQQHEAKLGPADVTSPDWFFLYLGVQSEEDNRGLSADDFRTYLKKPGCQVFVDGLDETPDDISRKNLAKLIERAASAYDASRFVVTSRPEGKVSINGFEEKLIADLEPAAIRDFLAKLAKQLYQDDEKRECAFREDLQSAVNGRPEIRKMTRNPVMLTALAVLQHNNIKLPEKRVDLYGSILEWLAKKRAKSGRLPFDICLLRLRELALAMQNHPSGRQKQVSLAWAGNELAKPFKGAEAAERFLVAEQSDSGIVVSRGSEIAYWHLTFQEYLAALEIAGWEEANQYKLWLSGKIYQPEWRETVLLYAGLLYKVGPLKVEALLRNLLDKLGEKPTLAARAQCVGLIGALLPDLVGYTVADPRYHDSLRAVMDIFDEEKSKGVPFNDRLAAAEALGQAGDPRLLTHEWVQVPESKNYWIGAQKDNPKGTNYDEEAYDDEQLRQIDLPAFRIGKYPVSVAQYLRFIEQGSFPDSEPERWQEQMDHPNWPVVNVTWHQANAYCEWAGGRLPTEEEWERAARGPHSTKYPWGNHDIDPTRANYDDSKIGHPTPVGLYPAGVSAEGALDLVGNVFEWTASKWEEGSSAYVWRGGSFVNSRRVARSSYRYVYDPDEQGRSLGFRLAWGIT